MCVTNIVITAMQDVTLGTLVSSLNLHRSEGISGQEQKGLPLDVFHIVLVLSTIIPQLSLIQKSPWSEWL